jgi:hypothetical protein
MLSSKPKTTAKRIWRITASNPMGEWVDSVPTSATAPEPAPDASKAMPLQGDADGHWLMSSFDLLSGSEVTEDPDTVPGDLFDELFSPKPGAPKGTGE